MIVVDGLIDVGQSLGFNPLAAVYHQDRTFAGCQAARNFIGEVHVTRRIHQIENIGFAVAGLVFQPYGLGLNGDAALAFDLHAVQNLLGHLAFGQTAGLLDQSIRQRGFAVVDMGHDGKIADMGKGRRHAARALAHSQRFARPDGRLWLICH